MAVNVVKADGSLEQYFHTKVIGTINNALDSLGTADAALAGHLAEVVTYFVNRRGSEVSSGEIFSIIKAVLEATDHTGAAAALAKHQYLRRLNRSRTEVLDVDAAWPGQLEQLWEESAYRSCWDKARIVAYLRQRWQLEQACARAVASAVERKVLNMGSTVVCSGLIKQLMLAETAAFARAQRQLEAV